MTKESIEKYDDKIELLFANNIVNYIENPKQYLTNVGIPQEMMTVVLRMLDPYPATRIQSVDDVFKYPIFSSLSYDLPIPGKVYSKSKYYADKLPTPISRIVIEWMLAVFADYIIPARTLFLAIDILYRCYDFVGTGNNNTQLVSCACMYIASQIDNGHHALSVNELAYLTDKSSSEEEILSMVVDIVFILGGVLKTKTPFDYAFSLKSLLYIFPLVKDRDQYVSTNMEAYFKILESNETVEERESRESKNVVSKKISEEIPSIYSS